MSRDPQPAAVFSVFNIGLQESAYQCKKTNASWRKLRDTVLRGLGDLNPLALGLCELGKHEDGLDHGSFRNDFNSATHELHLCGSYGMYVRRHQEHASCNVTAVSEGQLLTNIMPPGPDNQWWRRAAAWTLDINMEGRHGRILVIIGHCVSGNATPKVIHPVRGTLHEVKHTATSFQKQNFWKALHQHAHERMTTWRKEAAAAPSRSRPLCDLPDGAVLMGDFNLAPDELPDKGSYVEYVTTSTGWRGDHLWVYGWAVLANEQAAQLRASTYKSDGGHTMVAALLSPYRTEDVFQQHRPSVAKGKWEEKITAFQSRQDATTHWQLALIGFYACHDNFISLINS